MARPSGQHSATKKGTNGTSDPKARGQVTAEGSRYGKNGDSPAGENATKKARAV